METFAAVSPAPGCPDRGLLINFDLGKLSADDLDAVALHISSCPSCEESLHALHDQPNEDSVVGRLKQSLGRAPLPGEAIDSPTESSSGTVRGDPLAPTLEDWSAEGAPGASEVFGSYELLGKIGQGGMGVIYRARQVSLNRTVALKMILGGQHAGALSIARFLREGRAIARLRHANIVQVYELGEREGLPYYSMELVEGKDLKRRLADGPFEPREAAELVRTLAEAVDYAHRAGVLHRDLKPANILLAEDGTPRITDFGLAKWLDAESGDSSTVTLTESEAILGSPSYMAPEQAEGRSADTGRATDVYALGAILYETLAGRPPFVGATKIQTMDLVRTAEPVPPSRLRRGIPPWLEAICLRCLEKSPARRYPTAQALADDLGSWLRHERPEGIPNWFARFGRGARRHAVAVVAGAAMLSAGAVAYLHVNAPERAIRRIESDLARGRPVTLIGQAGQPQWSRWRNGGSQSQSELAHDGTLGLRSSTSGLLELVPDPRSDSYRFAAQVRHETSESLGEVGLYFARTAHAVDRRVVHLVTLLSFSAVEGDAALRLRIGQLRVPVQFQGPPGDAAHLSARLLSDAAHPPYVDRRIRFAIGPRFEFLGEGNDRWHDLEVTVTPARVTARWDGHPLAVDTADIQQYFNRELRSFRLNAGPEVPGCARYS